MCEVAFVQDRQVNTDCTHATKAVVLCGAAGKRPQGSHCASSDLRALPGWPRQASTVVHVSWPLALMTWPSDREFFMKRMAEKPCALDARLTLAEQQCTGSAAACPRAILQGARSLCAGLYSVAGTVPRAKQCGRDLCQSVAACLCLIRAQTCSRWRA